MLIAEIGIVRENWANTMTADALSLSVARAPQTMVLIMRYKQFLGFHKEDFLTTCAIGGLRNDNKYSYIFMIPRMNSADKVTWNNTFSHSSHLSVSLHQCQTLDRQLARKASFWTLAMDILQFSTGLSISWPSELVCDPSLINIISMD